MLKIAVQIAKKFKDIDADLHRLKELVKAICDRFELSKAVISIALVDDAEMRKVNRKFLNRNCSTDCLSFDLSDDNVNKLATSELRIPLENQKSKIGDRKLLELVVNAEKAVKEAALRGHSSEAELALYITHGLLHNLGFDDSTQSQAKKMHDTEDEILQEMDYGSVYNS